MKVVHKERTKPDKPGHNIIRGNGQDQRYIVNMNSQLYPGRFNDQYDNDNQEAREGYFYQCLLRLTQVPDLESVAFPYLVGCGIAGGNWQKYKQMLDSFASNVEKLGVKVVIYRRPGD